MTNLEERLKVIYKLDLFFLIAGMAEIYHKLNHNTLKKTTP